MRSEHKFKILKQLNNTNQTESVRIEAAYDSPFKQSQNQLANPVPSDPFDQISLNESADFLSPLYTFDSSNGMLTVMNDMTNNYNNSINSTTNSLNTQNLYDLLVRLQQNDQLRLDTDSQLTSQFYLNSKQLDSLLNNPVEGNQSQTDQFIHNENELADLEGLNIASLTPLANDFKPFECQELCCLLKFVALDEEN